MSRNLQASEMTSEATLQKEYLKYLRFVKLLLEISAETGLASQSERPSLVWWLRLQARNRGDHLPQGGGGGGEGKSLPKTVSEKRHGPSRHFLGAKADLEARTHTCTEFVFPLLLVRFISHLDFAFVTSAM